MYLATNMRDEDRVEVFATMYGNDPIDFVRVIQGAGDFHWGIYLDGKIVAVVGATPRWPNVWSAWAVATDDFPKVALAATRHVKRFMIPALLRSGAHRVEAVTMRGHAAAGWLERLGAKKERTLYKHGKNGETFVSFVWSRKSASRAAQKRGPRPA